MPGNRRKIKLKNPANLISAVAVLVGSIILSLIIKQNFFLVFISSFLVYIAAYVFFEKRRQNRELEDEYDDYDDDYDDYDGEYEEDDDYEDEEIPAPKSIRPVRRQNSSFDVMKSAKFNDTVPKEEAEPEKEEVDDSWRSMYNNLSDNSADSSFEEDYKKYFSTTLPDREEVSKAQQTTPTPARQFRENNRRDERKHYNRNDDYYDMESVDVIDNGESAIGYEISSEQTQGDASEESDEDEEGHIIDADDIETETQEIQNKVNDLITNKAPEDAVLAKSITAKLKFFRKTRKTETVEEEYDQDEIMSSNLQLIDELYTDTDAMETFKKSAPVSEDDFSAETTPQSEEEDGENLHNIQKIGDKIIETLRQADVEASVKEVTVGASVIRYDIRPRSMSKLNRIAKLESTLESALKVGKIRVVDVGSNRSLAGVEIANPERGYVDFQDCINSEEFQMNRSTTSCALGQDVYGETILADLKNLSHLLIVGQDAEEKNRCMHTLIASILSKVGVFHVDFVMIDISNRELNVYDPVPHMYSPVLNFADDALGELEALEKVIDTRLDLFQRSNARDVVSYNATKPETSLSRIIVFINELGDLMEHDARRTESLLSGILQKSRSTGVHFVIGTAHPTEDVLTGLIKVNMPSKICFALESAEDSEMILDVTGAEKLLGDGDMLYYPKGYLAPRRVQCASLNQEDVEALVESIL